jgi:hypothetical protein
VLVGVAILVDLIALLLIVDAEKLTLEQREDTTDKYNNKSNYETADIACVAFFALEQLLALAVLGLRSYVRGPRGANSGRRDLSNIEHVLGDQRLRGLLVVLNVVGVVHWRGGALFGKDNRVFDMLRLLGLLRFKRLYGILGLFIPIFHRQNKWVLAPRPAGFVSPRAPGCRVPTHAHTDLCAVIAGRRAG